MHRPLAYVYVEILEIPLLLVVDAPVVDNATPASPSLVMLSITVPLLTSDTLKSKLAVHYRKRKDKIIAALSDT